MNMTPESNPTSATLSIARGCMASCKRVLSQINQVRRTIAREFLQSFRVPEHMLRLALNEAEAIAWQSGFPQLVFPDLASEKAQAIVAWQIRQRAISR